jgi:hypothetical protein
MTWTSAASGYSYFFEWGQCGGFGMIVITEYGICAEVGYVDIGIGRMWKNGMGVGFFLPVWMRA